MRLRVALAILAAFVAGLLIDEDAAGAPAPRIVASTSETRVPPNFGDYLAGIHDRTPPTNPPTTVPEPRRATRTAAAPSGRVYPSDALLHALAMCETGGTMNQRIVSNTNPPYYSFFQWELGTWRSIGGHGDPRDASYEVQAPLARALILRSGWGQFPKCSKRIGAR